MRNGIVAGLDGQTVRALFVRKNGNRVDGPCCGLGGIDVLSELLECIVITLHCTMASEVPLQTCPVRCCVLCGLEVGTSLTDFVLSS
jgi:hypothetical protein